MIVEKTNFKIPSDEFLHSLTNGSSYLEECSFCGATHFYDVEDFGVWEEDSDGKLIQLEELRKLSAENSEKYIEHYSYL